MTITAIDAPLFSTSFRAAAAAARSTPKRRRQILEALCVRPMALFEISALLGVGDNQISGRITDLKRHGRIEETGEERTTPSGCAAYVYAITAIGRAELETLTRRERP